jgi:Icc-related predicted phosphoesterase
MTYTSKWEGNVDAVDGTAIFQIDGVEYSLHLDSFSDYQIVVGMLAAAFNQGRQFAEQAIRSHVSRALDDAKRLHAL